jgi:hypothetical protein
LHLGALFPALKRWAIVGFAAEESITITSTSTSRIAGAAERKFETMRDAGFEPPPASLREALRARCDWQTPLQVRAPETGFELFLA